MISNKKPIIILTGPTAVGKSELSIRLAKAIDGEIISADSMQVYRHMDIGSAKITQDEMDGVKHHLIDILEPYEEFHVVKFQSLAKDAMQNIYSNEKIPILVGGTGFYIQSVLYDIDFTESEEDETFRSQLEELARKEGNEVLFERLRKIDPESCNIIHPNNIKRVVRAIEFYEKTGKRISEHNKEQHANEAPYNFAYFVLDDDRAVLYERINKRVDAMLEAGLIDEVKSLKDMGCTSDMVSMQGLGYKEILEYLDGKCTLDEAIYKIKRDTRHFAKRQLTWFRRERDIIRLFRPDFKPKGNADENTLILEYILQILEEKGIAVKENQLPDEH